MQRGNSKYGPRLDDELKHDTEGLVRGGHETRAEESRGSEPSGEDQPSVSLNPGQGGTGRDDPNAAAIEQRADLAGYLGRAPYPLTRDQVLDLLAERHAPDHWVGSVKALPQSTEVTNLEDLWEHLGPRIEEAGS